MKRARPLKAKKLLVSSLGIGVLTIASCAAFPGCNLMAPPSCEREPNQPGCFDMNVPDLETNDLQATDLRKEDSSADLANTDLADAD